MMKFFNTLFSKKDFNPKQNLYGKWQAIEFDDQPIENRNFISVELILDANQIQINTEIKAFGGTISTESNGEWDLLDETLYSQFGENYNESKLYAESKNIITFIPDPFFNAEGVSKSKYIRVK